MIDRDTYWHGACPTTLQNRAESRPRCLIPEENAMFSPSHSSVTIPECNACGACLICAACGTTPMVGAAVTGTAFLVHLHNCESNP